MLNAFLEDPRFAASAPCATLRQKSLGFIDVGARGGVHPIMEPLAGVTAVLGFEPDPEEYRRLQAAAQVSAPWATLAMEPWALADTEGRAPLHVLSMPTNCSLRPPNMNYVRRYEMERFVEVGVESVATTTMDKVLFGARAQEDFWGEFVKLDTQGTEYEVLLGAERMLAERTVAVLTEVSFFEIYEGQRLFAEMEQFLRQRGFCFYGFTTAYTRTRKLLDKRRGVARERAFYGDAVFFKDPLPGGAAPAKLSLRGTHALFVCAVLLGYYDFALELALATWARGEEAQRLTDFVQEQADKLGAPTLAEAQALAERLRADPSRAVVEVGRLVDQRRHFADYNDVK